MIFGETIVLNIKLKSIEKCYPLKNILIKFRLHLKDIINNLKKSDMRKIQLTITIDFISSMCLCIQKVIT